MEPYRDVSKISSPCQSEQLPVFAYHRGRTGGEQIEIQIRTKEMHLIAERGIAAHWKYKERGKVDDETASRFDWLRDLLNWQQTVRNPDEFLDTVKTDLFESEIYVFTPKVTSKNFRGCNPIDFAYSFTPMSVTNVSRQSKRQNGALEVCCAMAIRWSYYLGPTKTVQGLAENLCYQSGEVQDPSFR